MSHTSCASLNVYKLASISTSSGKWTELHSLPADFSKDPEEADDEYSDVQQYTEEDNDDQPNLLFTDGIGETSFRPCCADYSGREGESRTCAVAGTLEG